MSELTVASMIGVGAFGVALATSLLISGDGPDLFFAEDPVRPLILSTRSATEGAPAYDHFCASCHGYAGEGGPNGPPLVHSLYDIGRRTDSMFVAAIRHGAPEKNWEFGPMPPIEGISPRYAAALVGFVAELQRYNAR